MAKNGKILEGMTSNFFYVLYDDGRVGRRTSDHIETIVTAQRGILLGVTRRTILRVVSIR